MDVVVYLRNRIKEVRDGYDSTVGDRKKLYAFLKTNSSWKKDHVRHKIGRFNHDWLIELVRYGDEHGWDKEITRVLQQEVRNANK